jgi:hypothetical protein
MHEGDGDTQELFRTTIEENVRRRCQGSCRFCGSPYGGPDLPYGDWEDLASWIFGHCSFHCRLAAGEPRQFDMERALKILHPDGN